MNLLNLRRQLHAAWVRLKRGEPGSNAAHELAARRWWEGRYEYSATPNTPDRHEAEFDAEHWRTAGRSCDDCDPATCPYGS